jgi:ATPase subunit of ABC transporter with duplicated ATPase domains
MTQLSLRELSFGFSTPLFERVSATFDAGWTGLTGPNGSGKTTLLRLISGDLEPAAGRVELTPSGSIVWCRQQSSGQRPELERFAADGSAAAQRWRGLLGVRADTLDHFERLSAGERKRWQIAWALAQEPEVLLLDEPTNHLDSQARATLERALARFAGVGILVSHDRALLDALTTRSGRLGARGLELCPGNYTASQAEWEARREATLSAQLDLRKETRRVQSRLIQQRERSVQADADRSARRGMKDKNDHDARSMLRKNRAEMASRRLARDAVSLSSRLGRVERKLAELHVEKRLGATLLPEYRPWPKPIVLHLAFDALYVGSRRLLGQSSLDVARHDKLVIHGPNGAGKTCLIGELERQNPNVFAQSVYLPQSLPDTLAQQLRAAVGALPPAARGRVLNLVAALGSDPDAVLASSAWSPGEARKVALAWGLVRQAPALILDEPTNHFDLPSIERLEQLLHAFPGCVVLISHDQALAERVATRRVALADGQLVER